MAPLIAMLHMIANKFLCIGFMLSRVLTNIGVKLGIVCVHLESKLLFDVVGAFDVREGSQSSPDRFLTQLHMAPPHCLTTSVQRE